MLYFSAELVGCVLLFVDGYWWSRALRDHQILLVFIYALAASVIGSSMCLVTWRREKLLELQHRMLAHFGLTVTEINRG